MVWVSADGVNWTARKRVVPPEATSAGLRQVAAFQDRLVAIGTAQTSTGGRRPFSAVSEDDGSTWTTAWLPAEQAAAVYDLAAAEQGLVAVGWHGRPGEGDSAAWISPDGSAWSRLDLTEDRLGGAGEPVADGGGGRGRGGGGPGPLHDLQRRPPHPVDVHPHRQPVKGR